MLYCVEANLRLETPAKRDTLNEEIKAFIGRKLVWGETRIFSYEDENGYSASSIEVRFQVKTNMDELYAQIKDKMERIPVLKGTVSKHDCSHDRGGIPCVISEEYTK